MLRVSADVDNTVPASSNDLSFSIRHSCANELVPDITSISGNYNTISAKRYLMNYRRGRYI